MIEVFLFLLLKDPHPERPLFWITAVVYVLLLAGSFIGKWHILKTAGRKPWHCLIPFLGNRDLYDVCWDGRYGIAVSCMYLLMCILAPKNGVIPVHSLTAPALVILFLTALAVSAIMKFKLCRSFGRGGFTVYGLIFLEGAFYPVCFRNCEYRGRTLKKNDPKLEKEVKPHHKSGLSRTYMINLYQTRSRIALIACVLTSACCMFAVAGGLIEDPSVLTPERGSQLFKLFTVNSNLFSAIGAVLMIPYAVEGIRKKHFTYPKWIQLIQYSGAICTTLTFLFALFLILPTRGIQLAFMHMNFWLHLVCPMLTLVLIFSAEADMKLTLKESVLCLTPFYIYAVVYIFNVVLIGEANGGWRDIYKLATYLPATISAPLMFMLSFFVANSIRTVYNRLVDSRQQEMKSLWGEDLSPIEIKIEAYGLGRYTGMHDEDTNIVLPVDIFRRCEERYDVTIDELARAFSKGVADGLKERSDYFKMIERKMDLVIGTPEKLPEKTEENK